MNMRALIISQRAKDFDEMLNQAPDTQFAGTKCTRNGQDIL